MTSRRLAIGILACAILVAAASALASSGGSRRIAKSTLLVYHPALTEVPAGGLIRNTASDGVTLNTGAGHITCAGATLSTTAHAHFGDRTATTVDTVSFTPCTDTLPAVTITTCHNSSLSPSELTFTDHLVNWHRLVVRCPVTATTACYYGAALLSGAGGNNTVSATASFTAAAIAHTVPVGAADDAGAAACGTGGTLTTRFTRLTYVTSGTLVTVT